MPVHENKCAGRSVVFSILFFIFFSFLETSVLIATFNDICYYKSTPPEMFWGVK